MLHKSQKTIILIVSILPILFIMPTYSIASNYEYTYTLDVQNERYRFSHRLYVSVPFSLYEYYHRKSHDLRGDSDYSKFVTPNAVKSIAENIQNTTRSRHHGDEEFANAVLMLVRQVRYVKSNVKYPAEAIVDNSGDCDVLSILAASIMAAGGLDVVLLYYKELSPSHINLGVYLPDTPFYQTWLRTPTGYEYNGKKYWVAECTPQGEWKVGDQPASLAGAKPRIISLENCEITSPAHISSSLDSPLIPSSISIDLSLQNASVDEKERVLTISGSISPTCSGEKVTMYVDHDGYPLDTFGTITDEGGNYSFTLNVTLTGTYFIKTSWGGVSDCAGSDSEALTVFVSLPVDELEVAQSDLLARASAVRYNALIGQGIQEFLKVNLLGTGVLLSGEFIILESGQPMTPQTITIPAYVQQMPMMKGWERGLNANGERITPDYVRTRNMTVAEKTITISSEETKYLCFMLLHNGGNNYSLSVRRLDDSDLSQMAQRFDVSSAAFANASAGTRENMWYNVAANMSENEVSATLYDTNSTLLRNTKTRYNTTGNVKFGILMEYNPATVVAFKNLKFEIPHQSSPAVESTPSPKPANELERLAPYIILTALLIATSAAVAYVEKRKRTRLANYIYCVGKEAVS